METLKRVVSGAWKTYHASFRRRWSCPLGSGSADDEQPNANTKQNHGAIPP